MLLQEMESSAVHSVMLLRCVVEGTALSSNSVCMLFHLDYFSRNGEKSVHLGAVQQTAGLNTYIHLWI